jgi:DNA-binding transcriptional regulator YdaS (Cro superfamily)
MDSSWIRKGVPIEARLAEMMGLRCGPVHVVAHRRRQDFATKAIRVSSLLDYYEIEVECDACARRVWIGARALYYRRTRPDAIKCRCPSEPRKPTFRRVRQQASSLLIGSRVRRLRLALEMKQGEAARRIGINPTLLAELEKGRCRFAAERLPAIARALSCTTDWLLTGDEDLEPEALRDEIGAALRRHAGDEVAAGGKG